MSGHGPSSARRASVKGRVSNQAQLRRQAARSRQNDARRDLTNHARSLALGVVDGGGLIGDDRGPLIGDDRGSADLTPKDSFREESARRGVSGPPGRALEMCGEELGAFATETFPDPEFHMDADSNQDTCDDETETEAGRDTSSRTRTSHSQHTPRLHTSHSPTRSAGQQRRRSSSAPGPWSTNHYARASPENFGDSQFMRPEWMVDIPDDLATGWCVLPRPQGQRSLVVASRGATVARGKSGRVVKRFASALPGGSPKTKHGNDEVCFCILDCVFHESDQTFYVLDCLAWNGVSLYDCSATMRLSWLASKLGDPELAECPDACRVSSDGTGNAFRFLPLPVFGADAFGIKSAYLYGTDSPQPGNTRDASWFESVSRSAKHGVSGFQKDGLLFLANDGFYALGASPLAVLWKDQNVSNHFLEENGEHAIDPDTQRVVLRLNARNGDVTTSDAAPTAFARLPMEYVNFEDGGSSVPGGGLRDGSLVKFKVGEGGLVFDETGVPTSADLVYEGVASQKRQSADALTKIVFQYNARREPITIGEILGAVQRQSSS